MQIEVNQDKLTLIQEEQEVINSGAIDYYEVNITFDSSWDSLIKKVILISNNEQEGEEIAVINNRISIDVKHFGTYYIGIVGYTIIDDVKTKQISTNLESIYINQGAGSIECEEHEIPGPSEWDIYIAQIQAMCNQSYTKNETDAFLNNKVDKEEGKGLSSNDFTTEEKDKLSNLENYDDTEIKEDIEELYNQIPEGTANGTTIHLTDSSDLQLKNVEIQGSSNGVTGDVEVKFTGSNLFDIDYYSNINNYDGWATPGPYRYKLTDFPKKLLYIKCELIGTAMNNLYMCIGKTKNPNEPETNGMFRLIINGGIAVEPRVISCTAFENIYISYICPTPADIATLKDNYRIMISEDNVSWEEIQEQSVIIPFGEIELFEDDKIYKDNDNWFLLKDEVTTEITDVSLITALEQLLALRTYRHITHIENDKDAYLDITYNKDLSSIHDDYNLLRNKPSINGVQLTGNKTAANLGLAQPSDLLAHNISLLAHEDIRNAIPTKNSDLDNDTDYQSGTQVDTSINNHNVSDLAHTDIRQTANEAKAIARGKSESRTFDTTADLISWISDISNKNVLKIGDNLYDKTNGVPDYWISAVLEEPNADGYYYDISPLDAEVPDISNMVTTDTAQTISGNKNFTGELKKNGVNVITQTELTAGLDTKNRIFQVEEFPESPSTRDIYQYMGTDIEYKYGHFYSYNSGSQETALVTCDDMTLSNIVVDLETFKAQMLLDGNLVPKSYSFTYRYDLMSDTYNWFLEDISIDISSYGISYEGTPSDFTTIVVTYKMEEKAGWKEQEIQTGTQFSIMPEPSEATYGKLLQAIKTHSNGISMIEFVKGNFYETIINRMYSQYVIDPTVNSETTGVYYTRRGLRYTEVTLPMDYSEGATYYRKELIPQYEYVKVPMAKEIKRKYVSSDDVSWETSGEAPDITIEIYDEDITDNVLVDVYARDDETFTYLSQNMLNNIVNENIGSFSFRVKSELPMQWSLYYTITPIENIGGML